MSPPSSKRNSGNGNGITTIDKLDYPPPNSPRRPLLAPDSDTDSQRRSQDTSYAGSFFEQVAEGIYEQDRVKMQRAVLRWLSFAWAIVICLCAGSITAFSLYGHLFQSKLHLQVCSSARDICWLPSPLRAVLRPPPAVMVGPMASWS